MLVLRRRSTGSRSATYSAPATFDHTGGTPCRFELVVLSEKTGKLVLRQELEAKEPPDTEQGGPGGVRVTDISAGSTVLAR